MQIAIPVDDQGRTGHAWGRAHWIGLASVSGPDADGAWQIDDWRVDEVGWDVLHDTGTEGGHHARVVRFLRDNQVGAIVVDHVGEGMRRMLASMSIPILPMVPGDARDAVVAAAEWAARQ